MAAALLALTIASGCTSADRTRRLPGRAVCQTAIEGGGVEGADAAAMPGTHGNPGEVHDQITHGGAAPEPTPHVEGRSPETPEPGHGLPERALPDLCQSSTTKTAAVQGSAATAGVVDAGVEPAVDGTAPAPCPTPADGNGTGACSGAPLTSPTTLPTGARVVGTGGTTTTSVNPPQAIATTVAVPSTILGREPTGPPPVAPAGAPGDVEVTLACIRSYEQNDNPAKGPTGYASNTGNGHYGAYQFNQSTWDGAVARAGYPEWSGRRASEAPPEVQDAAAAQLLSERGLQPWPTPNRRCR